MLPDPAGNVAENDVSVRKLHAERRPGEALGHLTSLSNRVLFLAARFVRRHHAFRHLLRVRTATPSWVTATVCSKCTDSPPVAVTTVH